MGLHHHHGHAHDHGHGHHHHHGKGASKRALLIAFLIITAFLVVEIVGGILTNSLALLSDAGHMVSDASALLLSLIALHVAARPPSTQKTFRAAPPGNSGCLDQRCHTGRDRPAILWEAYERLRTPPEVAKAAP